MLYVVLEWWRQFVWILWQYYEKGTGELKRCRKIFAFSVEVKYWINREVVTSIFSVCCRRSKECRYWDNYLPMCQIKTYPILFYVLFLHSSGLLKKFVIKGYCDFNISDVKKNT